MTKNDRSPVACFVQTNSLRYNQRYSDGGYTERSYNIFVEGHFNGSPRDRIEVHIGDECCGLFDVLNITYFPAMGRTIIEV